MIDSKLIVAATLAVACIGAFAQATPPVTPKVDQREAVQQKRIDQGVKSGQLTDKEAARLQKGQQRVQKMEDKARADGKVTPEERRRIERAQDRESQRIQRETNDKQRAR
jgi:hypothetical protein